MSGGGKDFRRIFTAIRRIRDTFPAVTSRNRFWGGVLEIEKGYNKYLITDSALHFAEVFFFLKRLKNNDVIPRLLDDKSETVRRFLDRSDRQRRP